MEYTPEKFNGLVERIIKNLNALDTKEVMVGIPAGDARQDDSSINNAALGYIHEFGAPEAGIPARPFLYPGVANTQPIVIPMLEQAAVASVEGSAVNVEAVFNRVGSIAASEVRKIWDNNDWEDLADSTVKQRLRRQGPKGGNIEYQEAYKQAKESGDTASLSGMVQPLLDTGSLRNSITFAIEEKGSA